MKTIDVLNTRGWQLKPFFKAFVIILFFFSLASFFFASGKTYSLLIEKGDGELLDFQFERAEALYSAASFLKPWSEEPKERKRLVSNIKQDPFLGLDFFKSKGATELVELLKKSREDSDFDELVENALALLNSKMPKLAIYPLEKATILAPERKDLPFLLKNLYHYFYQNKEKELVKKLSEDPFYQIFSLKN